MSAKLQLSDRELLYIDICNHYINCVRTLVVSQDYYTKFLKYNLIDFLPFN